MRRVTTQLQLVSRFVIETHLNPSATASKFIELTNALVAEPKLAALLIPQLTI
jgi:hypothetical protein